MIRHATDLGSFGAIATTTQGTAIYGLDISGQIYGAGSFTWVSTLPKYAKISKCMLYVGKYVVKNMIQANGSIQNFNLVGKTGDTISPRRL